MRKSLAWRDRLLSAAVGAAVASVLVPAEAHAPASLGAAGQFNLFPYNTSYNRNSAPLGRFGATLRTTSLANDAASQYVGRGSAGEMFGDRFLSSSGRSRFGHASHRLGSGLLSGNRGSSTIFTSAKPGNTAASAPSSYAGTSTSFARRAGSGSVGVASKDSDGTLFYASASQVAAVTSLDMVGAGSSPGNTSWSNTTSGGFASGGSGTSEGGGHTALTVSGAGAFRSGAASPASSGSAAHSVTTRTVSLGSLNGSVVNTGGSVSGANNGQAMGSQVVPDGAGSSNPNPGTEGGSLFPDTPPVSVMAPAPVPEPGILVTTVSLLAVTGFGLLRGRLRRA